MFFRTLGLLSRRLRPALACVFIAIAASAAPAQAHHRHLRQAAATSADEYAYRVLNSSTIKPFLVGTYPEPRSRYCILIDADTGHVLYARNPYARRPPASLTKIMAAIILLEHGRLTDTVTAPADVVGLPETSLHLRPGEKISLEDLLYAMLLRSANDCPVAGAYYLSGSTPAFVALMNAKAAELGCTDTHFVTPNGLYDPNHYSCAADLAKIARYAVLDFPEFDRIVDTSHRRIRRSIDTGDTLVSSTFESFLKFYPGADGIKTGYISQAGHCFIGSATRRHWRLIAVALDSDYCREDVMGMLSYGFAHFRPHVYTRRGTPEGELNLPGVGVKMPVVAGGDLTEFRSADAQASSGAAYAIVVAPRTLLRAPIKMGEAVGQVTLLRDGKAVATAPVVAAQDYSPPILAGVASLNLRSIAVGLGRMGRAWLLALVCIISMIGYTASRYAGSTAKNHRRSRRRLSP